MSDIAEMYEKVMNGIDEDLEKTASEEVELNNSFLEKVASGDEEAVSQFNQLIEEARSQGASDEQIEAVIEEAMSEKTASENDFEAQKIAAYEEGLNKAFADALQSDMAKEAGVTEQDLMEYDLGTAYGQGYAEGRAMVDDAIEKIAKSKAKVTEEVAEGLLDKLRRKGTEVKEKGMKMHEDLSEKLAPKTTPAAEAAGLSRAEAKQLKKMREEGLAKGRRRANVLLGTAGLGAAGLGTYGGIKGYQALKKK